MHMHYYTVVLINVIRQALDYIYYRSIDHMPTSQPHMMPVVSTPTVPDHCNMPTDLRIKSESNDSVSGGMTEGSATGQGGSSGANTSHTQIDQSNAQSSQSMNLSAVIAASNEAVCSTAPGTKLHAA